LQAPFLLRKWAGFASGCDGKCISCAFAKPFVLNVYDIEPCRLFSKMPKISAGDSVGLFGVERSEEGRNGNLITKTRPLKRLPELSRIVPKGRHRLIFFSCQT